ncbi:MAG: hypothetical protein GDA53_00335 [Rhodobacteraceae bacterium]|nr:hypothetical protein [Paracoccaceae bacterium]
MAGKSEAGRNAELTLSKVQFAAKKVKIQNLRVYFCRKILDNPVLEALFYGISVINPRALKEPER